MARRIVRKEDGCDKTIIVEHDRNFMVLRDPVGKRVLEIVFTVGPDYVIRDIQNNEVESIYDNIEFKTSDPFFFNRYVSCERIDTNLQRLFLSETVVLDSTMAGYKYDSLFSINDLNGIPKVLYSPSYGPVMLKTNGNFFIRKQG